MKSKKVLYKDPGGLASFPYSDEGRLQRFTAPTLAKRLGLDASWVRRLIYKEMGLYAHKEGGVWIILIDPLFIPQCIKHRWKPGPI